ncbi:MAG: hypothetical protein MK085_05905, partial [Phycisphaerales bacterium]|nr:hypothetical protein [Phycisphaerales bacterium]
EPGEEPDRQSEEEKVEQIIDIILEVVEPEMWVENGGDAASIRYYQGVLIVRAPDFVHRLIGGYPFAAKRAPLKSSSAQGTGGRYVTFNAPISIVENVKFRTNTVTGSTGGTNP